MICKSGREVKDQNYYLAMNEAVGRKREKRERVGEESKYSIFCRSRRKRRKKNECGLDAE